MFTCTCTWSACGTHNAGITCLGFVYINNGKNVGNLAYVGHATLKTHVLII